MSEALAQTLAAPELSRLADCEGVIERGMATFIEVGSALMEVRDSRLYRDAHGTFEDYCRERWSLSLSRSYQLIDAAQVSTVVEITNERQARELAPLRNEPEQMREAWAEANEGGEPTALKVREAVRSRMDVHYSSDSPEWSTPQDLFDELDSEFHFALDVCATTGNAKCERYFTVEQDGLAQEWTGTCWMNPPYGGEIGRWVGKAWDSAQHGATVVCLVPGRIETGWWWNYCRFGEVRVLRGRLKFGGGENTAPFPSVVVVFGPGREASTRYWDRA